MKAVTLYKGRRLFNSDSGPNLHVKQWKGFIWCVCLVGGLEAEGTGGREERRGLERGGKERKEKDRVGERRIGEEREWKGKPIRQKGGEERREEEVRGDVWSESKRKREEEGKVRGWMGSWEHRRQQGGWYKCFWYVRYSVCCILLLLQLKWTFSLNSKNQSFNLHIVLGHTNADCWSSSPGKTNCPSVC